MLQKEGNNSFDNIQWFGYNVIMNIKCNSFKKEFYKGEILFRLEIVKKNNKMHVFSKSLNGNNKSVIIQILENSDYVGK